MKARVPKQKGAGVPGNMNDLLKQAQKMQEQAEAMQAELETREYEIKAGGGLVTVMIDGKKQLKTLDISPDIVDPDDVETLQDLILAAVNEAIATVEEISAKEMEKITGKMNVPGLM